MVAVEYDAAKNQRNMALRGLSFELVRDFDFDSALIRRDHRHVFEIRYQAVGQIGDDVMFVVFTMRGEAVRVISLRRASRKERNLYEQTQD
jgi:uncharacterized DUF497 family protein